MKCLVIMDQLKIKRKSAAITKRGKPVAKLVLHIEYADEIYDFPVANAALTPFLAALPS